MNYIILSEKKWNTTLVEILNKKFTADKFLLINSPTKLEELVDDIQPSKIFIPHWSYIIPSKIYEKYECIVFHMTDLPYGRGGSPLQNLIVRGKKKTKISALRVIKELDAGEIYLKKDLMLNGTAEEIFLRANRMIELMIEQIIKDDITPMPQQGEITVFKRRTPEMSNIEHLDSLEMIFDHIRMLDAEGYPNAYIETDLFKFEFTGANFKPNNCIIADVRITKK